MFERIWRGNCTQWVDTGDVLPGFGENQEDSAGFMTAVTSVLEDEGFPRIFMTREEFERYYNAAIGIRGQFIDFDQTPIIVHDDDLKNLSTLNRRRIHIDDNIPAPVVVLEIRKGHNFGLTPERIPQTIFLNGYEYRLNVTS